MDKIKILSDQYNDGLMTDWEYTSSLLSEIGEIWNRAKHETGADPEVMWLANRLAQATQV